MKVVIDSNVFVSCMATASSYHIIFQKLTEGAYQICITTDIALEYLEVFQTKFSTTKADNLFRYLSESPFVIVTAVHFKWNLIEADKDDNKFVDCAIAAAANFIVSNDRHFNVLERQDFPKVTFITIDQFAAMLQSM